MAMSKQEMEMMDDYFRTAGMGHLWTNIKKLMSGSGCDCDKEEIENALTILSTSLQNLREEVNKIDVQPATPQDIDDLFS